MPVSLKKREEGGEEVSKKAIILAEYLPFGQPQGGNVLISSFLQPFTSGQGQNFSL